MYYTSFRLIQHSKFFKHFPDGNVLRVRLHLPDANSPLALGTGDDGRLLGLSMKSVVIREREAAEAAR